MLNQISLKRLEGVHPHLVAVIKRAAELMPVGSDITFQVTEGVRSLARQKQLVAEGASRTMNSRHIPAANGYSHAVDLVVYVGDRISWEFPLYKKLSDVVKKAASEMGRSIEWGGDWQSFKDGPHFQLPFYAYPGITNVKDDPAPQPSEDDLRTLVIGSSGAQVIKLQQALNRHGAAVRVDGDFGSRTFDAVKAFQGSHDLKPDGIVGKTTWEVLR